MGDFVPLGGSHSPVAWCAYHKTTLSAHQMERKECLQIQCDRLCKNYKRPYWKKREKKEELRALQKEKLREAAEQPSEASRNNVQKVCESPETQRKLHIICDIIDLKRELTSECDGSILDFLSSLGLLNVPEESEILDYFILTTHLDDLTVSGISKLGDHAEEKAAKNLFDNLQELLDSSGGSAHTSGLVPETLDREKIVEYIMSRNGTKLSKSINTMLQLYACGLIARPQITKGSRIGVMIPSIGVRCAEDQKHLRNAVSALFRSIVRKWEEPPSAENSAERVEKEDC